MSWAMIGAAGITTIGGLIGGGRGSPAQSNSSGWSSSNNNSTGSMSGTSTGTTSGTTTGSTTGTVSGRAMPVIPAGWDAAYAGMQPGATGFTPAQLAALGGMQGLLGGGSAALADPARYFREFADNPATTLEQMYAKYPDMYQRPGDVTAQMVDPSSGAAFMGAYNPFEDEMVARAVGDMDRAFARRQTALDNRLTAAGAFGGSASALENALLNEDYFKTAGDAITGLRSAGFNTRAQLGQQDASRALQGAGMNQSAALTADTGNRDALQGRQMFDANAAIQNQNMRQSAVRDWSSTLGQGLNFDSNAAMSLLTGGGLGQNQNLAWLAAGLPLFGSMNNQTSGGTTTGTASGTTSGTTSGTQTQSGTQTGSQTGSGTQQMPGPSFGNMLGNFGNLLGAFGQMGWNPFGGATGSGGSGAYPSFTSPWNWAQ